MLKKYKSQDIMYGIFDESYLSLMGTSTADEQFQSLTDALAWIGDQLEGEEADDLARYSIYVCRYSERLEGWVPVLNSEPLSVDARYFTPIGMFLEEEK